MTIHRSDGANILTAPVINVGSDAEGDLYYRNASGIFTRLAKGTQNYLLRAGASIPEYAAPNSIITLGSDANGDIYYRNSDVLQRLPKGTDAQILTLASGLPSWENNPALIGTTARRSGCVAYKDADEIYILGNIMDCDGKYCYWDTQLTFQAGSGGSNAASSNLGNSEWHYIYLDYSSITSGTILTAANFLNSTAAPAWSDSKKGYYNGSDRCIGAVLTNGSAQILAFNWIEGYYEFTTMIAELSSGQQTSYTDVDLKTSVPDFGKMAVNLYLSAHGKATTTNATIAIRENAAANTDYIFFDVVWYNTSSHPKVTALQITDTAQIIEYIITDGNAEASISVKGFLLSI